MLQNRKLFGFSLAILSISCAAITLASAQNAPSHNASATAVPPSLIKDKYHVAEVDTFDIKPGIVFPPDYVKVLQDETVKQLLDAKLFAQIEPSGQAPADPASPILRLTGTIHNYKQGSRARRYTAGFGAGASEIDAQLTLVDVATGQTLAVEDVRGVLLGGLFGGDEAGAARELARQVVMQAKMMLARKLPGPSSGSGDVAPISEPDRHNLSMDAKKWSEGESRLADDSAAGYRVMGLALTGSFTADLNMEKFASPPSVYQYRWIHMRLATHLEKDVEKAAAEGYRASPYTLATLGPYLTVVMEKSPEPSAIRYHYRVAETVRVSNAQKDIEARQREGYAVVDEAEFGGIHIVLFEKPAEEGKK